MRIAVAQMNSRPGDFDRTASRMVEQSRVAASRGAELIVFPTPLLTGPDPWSQGESLGFAEDLSSCMGRLAEELACPALVPVVLTPPSGPFHDAVLLAEGRVTSLRLTAQAQMGAPVPQASGFEGRPDPNEPSYAPVGFTLGDLRFGVAFDQDELGYVCESGVPLDAICYLESGCFCTDDETTTLAPSVPNGGFVADAANASAWIVAVGGMGGYESQVFCGGSFVMAPWGELAWAAPSFEEALGVVDVDPLAEGPLRSPQLPTPYQRMDFLWGALVLAIRDYVQKQGFSDVVLPLSGDLCSSAVAALATEALGPVHVHAVICGTQDASARDDARAIVRSLRIASTELSDDALLSAAAALGLALPSASPDAPAMCRELSHAAIRWLAGRSGALVLSAADKTALALDPAAHVSAADLAPLGDVYRTDVLALMHRRAAVSSAIPATAHARLGLPSALADMPGGGEELLSRVDACLLMYVERRLSLGQVVEEQGDEELARRVLELLDAGERQRRSVSCYPMVSERALFERRIPLGSAWSDRIREGSEPAEGSLVALITAMPEPSLTPRPEPRITTGNLSEEASRQVEGLLGMLQDMASGGQLQDGGLWGDGLFSEN